MCLSLLDLYTIPKEFSRLETAKAAVMEKYRPKL